jgi:trehalose 6-phosphate phosphatase
MFGKAVIDIKPSSFSKGTAVREVMAAPPFAGRRLVFIGDDTTDESVFAILPDFGGLGFAVGRGIKAAQNVFASPAQVRSWLDRVAEAAR